MVLSGEFPANAVHASASPSVVLAVGADDKFALPMTVALASALRHLDPTSHVTIYVLDGGIAPQNLARMRRCLHGLHLLAEINVIRVDDTRLDGFPTGWRLSKATYLRLLIPALIGRWVERVLYLDSDVLVTEDLSPLFRMELGDRVCFAVRDASEQESARLRRDFPRHSLGDADRYFNAGVLLINMAAWRSQRISEKAFDILHQHPDLCVHLDQCALNVAVAGQWGELDVKWNNQIRGLSHGLPHATEGGRSLGILHFTTGAKPWLGKRKCLHEGRYLKTLLRLPWLPTLQKLRLGGGYLLRGVKRDMQSVSRRLRSSAA